MLQVFKALADPTRLRLIGLLAHGQLPVQDLTAVLGMGQSRVSRHLKILLDAGLLEQMRQGTWSYYRLCLDAPFFSRLWSMMKDDLARNSDCRHDAAALVRLLDVRRERSREFFDHHARLWDDLSRRLLPTSDYRRELLKLIGHPHSLLEVGVGTGILLQEIARFVPVVIGLDQSAEMLAETRRRLAGSAAGPVDLRLGDMEQLPLEENCIDTVVLNMVLHHADRPADVLAEAARVLRPGGRVLVADYLEHRHDWVREAMADTWLGFSIPDVTAWLAAAGFDRIETSTLTESQDKQPVILVTGTKQTEGVTP